VRNSSRDLGNAAGVKEISLDGETGRRLKGKEKLEWTIRTASQGGGVRGGGTRLWEEFAIWLLGEGRCI